MDFSDSDYRNIWQDFVSPCSKQAFALPTIACPQVSIDACGVPPFESVWVSSKTFYIGPVLEPECVACYLYQVLPISWGRLLAHHDYCAVFQAQEEAANVYIQLQS